MTKKKKLNIDVIVDKLINGDTYKQIADFYGVSLTALHNFSNKAEFSARTRAAIEYSASTYADKAESVLINADSDKNEIARARELSQYYKWKAGKRNPKKYGERNTTELTGNLNVTTITGMEIK